MKLKKVNEDLKQNPQSVLNNANHSLKIFALSQPVALLGRESALTDKDLRKLVVAISFSGHITHFPHLNSNEQLVCAYNQFGMPGMAKIFECHSIENM